MVCGSQSPYLDVVCTGQKVSESVTLISVARANDALLLTAFLPSVFSEIVPVQESEKLENSSVYSPYTIPPTLYTMSTASSSRSAFRSLRRVAIAQCPTRSVRPLTTLLASGPPVRASAPILATQPRSRNFFSLPDISKLASQLTGATQETEGGRGVETDGEFQKFHARKILP